MTTAEESEAEFERFIETRRQRLEEVGTAPLSSLTRVAGTMAYFRDMPYPCSPEREKQIEAMHRNDLQQAATEHRTGLVKFAINCTSGKQGHAAQEIADGVLRTVERQDLVDPNVYATPENCCNLVLWDLRRRVAWMAAKARGEFVQATLKTREECLATYNARKIADEKWADNDSDPLSNIPPIDPLLAVKQQPTQWRHFVPFVPALQGGLLEYMAEQDRRLPPERDR